MRARSFASLPALALVLVAPVVHAEKKAERPGLVKLPEQIIVAKRMHPLAATEVTAVRPAIAPSTPTADFQARIEAAVAKEPF